MRKFMINVNGKSYEVEVEEIGGVQTYAAPAPAAVPQAAPAPAPAAAPAPQAAPAPAPAPAPAASGAQGGIQVTAPMPGTILKILASVGEAVKKGQPVVILEAMKMENEIVAPEDGTVASVNTTQGASVNNGDLLLTMN